MNGIVYRDGRSVSSTVHDRDRSRASSTAIPTGSHSRRHQHQNQQQQQHPPRPQSQPGGSPSGSGSSPPTARETFLNYFFGQNGPGPIAGSSMDRSHAQATHVTGGNQGVVPVGRDVYGGDTGLTMGLMAGKRSMDGNNAAFDMKSLGKHIEAVSVHTMPEYPCSENSRHLDFVGWSTFIYS